MFKKFRFLNEGIIIISIFLIISLSVISVFYYRTEKQRVFDSKYNELALDCRMKEKIIQRWQKQQIKNAELYSFNPFMTGAVDGYLSKHSKSQKQLLLKGFNLARELKDYDDLLLVSTSGKVEISLNNESNQLDTFALAQLRNVCKSKKAVFGNFFQNQLTKDIYFDIMSPVLSTSKNVIAVLILRFQNLNHPKTKFNSILEPMGSSLLFFNYQNKLYQVKTGNLVPLNKNHPVASAIQKKIKQYEGKNDANKKIIAYIEPVEKTNWYIVSQLPYNDILKVVYSYVKNILILNTLVILFLVLLIVFLYQYYKDQKKTEKNLRESEERFRQTFITIPESVSVNRISDGIYVDVNEGFTKITGFDKNEVIGKTTIDLNIWVNPKERDIFYKSLLKNGFYENLETKIRRKDGIAISVLFSSRIILLNEIPHMISIMHDITYRKSMEEELLRAKKKAEESDKMKSSFLHNISHEIRTPMNGIVGFAHLLKDTHIPQKEKEEFIEIINSNARQLLSIVDDVLEISRLESGSVPLHIKSFNLNELIKEIYLFFKPRVKIDFDYSCEIVFHKFFIDADKEKIRQVISCLISNAIKFTPAGKISFGYTLNDSHIQFFVKDTGIGIPLEEHEKIFERFYQSPNEMTIKAGGSGLGLNITKRFVELMNGKIWVESELKRGSSFHFTIPFKNSKIVADNQPESNIDLTGKKILVAEDEPANFQFLRIILSIKGAEVKWAENGLQAIQMVRNDKPDLVLMDLRMPVMDGLESTRQIKKLFPDLPVIAQTSYSLPEEKELSVKAGCNEFISKPIKANELFDLIQIVLSNFQSFSDIHKK